MRGKTIKTKLIKFLNLAHLSRENMEAMELFNKVALLFFLLFIGLVIQFSFAFISYSKGFYVITVLDVITSIIIFYLAWHLRKTNNYLFSASIYSLTLGAFFLYLIAVGGINNQGYIWTFLYPVGVIFFFGHKNGIRVAALFLILAIPILLTISVYNDYGIAFKIRYIVAYTAMMMMAYVFELTKNQLALQILKQNDELRVAKEKAENADRLKSEFLAQMSHEIRTPVGTILNYTSLLKSEFQYKLSEELAGSFNSIDSASTRLIRTIDLILDLSAIESGTYEPVFEKVQLKTEIIQPIINEFKHFAESKGVELIMCDDMMDANPISLDRYTITQTLSNLVHNALKYTYNGYVKICLRIEEGAPVLIVKDSGIGIAEEYIPSLFEKFSQETHGHSRSFEGSGLGLALVKEYCKINNAVIRVESIKGEGTTFFIEFSK
ncbi:MAG: HAMP domain-containing histidine kinase [Bacteroidetes bacterium]|nr:HAMP domain-containing histidine kinase [Bacteroidota bacterium]